VKTWLSSELSSKCGDLRSQIDQEIGKVKSWASLELVTKGEGLRSEIDREVGKVKTFLSSEVTAKCGEVRSQINQNIRSCESRLREGLASKCNTRWQEYEEWDNRVKNNLSTLRETVNQLEGRFGQIESAVPNLTSCSSSEVIWTESASPDSVHLKSWVLRGSIDGIGWTELNRQRNSDELNSRSVIRSFSISKSIECRFIRLRQTGKNHANNDILAFYHLEIFGSLRECAASRTASVAPVGSDPPSVPRSRSSSVVVDRTVTEIVVNSSRPLDGILSHLERKHEGNVHDHGILTITASSVFRDDPQYSSKNLGDPGTVRVFSSKNEVNQWVQWDFHEMRVLPTRYSIQTHNSPVDRCHLKSWVLEGSIEGLRWTELDHETNNDDLNGPRAIRTFSIAKSVECRLIRLRQTGKNQKNNDVLIFFHFEVFGSLPECDATH
jgi:hypothetical protein